jgi:hypothetical protein
VKGAPELIFCRHCNPELPSGVLIELHACSGRSEVHVILELSPDATPIARFAAATILYLHIGAGFIALMSGAAAAIARKGSRVHRRAGDVFVTVDPESTTVDWRN